jgi:hypothetical protein
MNRLFTSLLLTGSLLSVAAPHALAADDTVIARGNPPLTRDVSDASAGVTVFLLQVVATGAPDGTLDKGLLDGWATALSSDYGTMSSDDQQALTIMPTLNATLHQVWQQASPDDRESVRDAFRPLAQAWLDDMSCDSFVSLAQGGLVEASDDNLDRFADCLDADSAPAPSVVAPAAPTPVPVAASHPTSSGIAPTSPTVDYQRASQGLQASHNMYVNMSNVLLENHVGNMNAILNMGNSDYRYVYKP